MKIRRSRDLKLKQERRLQKPLNFHPEESFKVLVLRADRMGDVILSTPVLESIQKAYPKAEVDILLRAPIAPLLEGLSTVNRVIVYDPSGKHQGFKGFWTLYQEIRSQRYRFAVHLQNQKKLLAVCFLARISNRMGSLNSLSSFLFLNRGMRQKRSKVEMHEADYNLQLLRKMRISFPKKRISTQVALEPSKIQSVKEWIKGHGWEENEPFVLIHPGMGGSALNWPESHYRELAQKCLEKGYRVVISGGISETAMLKRFEESLQDFLSGGEPSLSSRILFYYAEFNGDPTIGSFAALISQSKVVVAPSTGPLHLAVSLKKRVVSFYSPIQVQSALRWGPYPEDDSHATVLVPEVYCGQKYKCLGGFCNYYPCMKSLSVKEAMEALMNQWQLSEGEAS